MKLKLNIVDTVVFRNGKLSAWWGTDKDGIIKKKPPQKASLEAVRQRFLDVGLSGMHDSSNLGRYVCVERRGGGAAPRCLKRDSFNTLAEEISEESEADRVMSDPSSPSRRRAPSEFPVCIQAYVPPHLDLRYITTYVCEGGEVTCTTFPRRFSRRYVGESGAATGDDDGAGSGGAKGDASGAEPPPEVNPHVVTLDSQLKAKFRRIVASIV